MRRYLQLQMLLFALIIVCLHVCFVDFIQHFRYRGFLRIIQVVLLLISEWGLAGRATLILVKGNMVSPACVASQSLAAHALRQLDRLLINAIRAQFESGNDHVITDHAE